VTGVYSRIFRVPAAEQQRFRVADSKALRVLVTQISCPNPAEAEEVLTAELKFSALQDDKLVKIGTRCD
jgi:hypothetical protein